MCGIAGFINFDGMVSEAEQLINKMCQVIRHRGPDDQGTWTDEHVALGMRRLSIIDVHGGHQPIFNEDKSIVIVFNGEIYNYRQLQAELQSLGHHFETQSDTEAIVHAYEAYGDDCVTKLRGMFAFALWDSRRQRLLAARDRFGKKPLNYYWDGKHLFFGSEIKSLLQANIPREVNHAALDEYLIYRYVPTPLTLFKGVMKLPAGHTLTYEHGQISVQRYWDLPFTPTCDDDETTAIERIQALIKDAISVRLMSEVPLGAFLSGGIDSSVVVGFMSQMLTQPVKTFSIGFEGDSSNELPYARSIARQFGTDHHEFMVNPDLITILPQLVWDYDEPFGDSSMLPTYYVSKLAREHVTVALTGDGGDEIFAGYTHYAREQMISHIPGIIRSVLGYASNFMPDGMRGKKRLRNLHHDLPIRYVQGTMVFPVGSRASMYTSEYRETLGSHDPYARQVALFKDIAHLDVVTQMQYADAHGYLTDDILVKVDKASMFNSLETRAPLLDQNLVEYVASLPSSLRMHNGDGTLKYLLKRAAADILPAEILTRKKQGFSMPMDRWFRHELSDYAHDILESTQARQRGIIHPQFISHLLESHQNNKLVDHSSPIWTLLCLELWFQIYMDTPHHSIQYGPHIQTLSNR